MEDFHFLNHLYLLIQFQFQIEYVQLHQIYRHITVNNYEYVPNDHNLELLEIK